MDELLRVRHDVDARDERVPDIENQHGVGLAVEIIDDAGIAVTTSLTG